jgi:hypothetical protein
MGGIRQQNSRSKHRPKPATAAYLINPCGG